MVTPPTITVSDVLCVVERTLGRSVLRDVRIRNELGADDDGREQ